MKILRSRLAVMRWRKSLKGTLGFVPTMGALHEGHASLVRKSGRACDQTLVSIFVNPTQFAAGEDFSRYPRTEAADFKLLRALGVDAVYCPRSVKDLYPHEPSLRVQVPEKLSTILCGRFRPGHFDGVATIVLKLFLVVNPSHAYFGEKDYQQLQVIKALVRDFLLDLKIVSCPTIREKSGLAMSSRNRYLQDSDRDNAALLFEVLTKASSPQRATQILREKGFRVDYVEVWTSDLSKQVRGRRGRWLAAVRMKNVRLIDNLER